MIDIWHDRIANNIFPLSVEKENIFKALEEWFYTGECFDLEEPIETCEICGQENLRYQFEIKNKLNLNTMLIGSECILRFDISVYENGERLSRDDAEKSVQRDRRKLIQRSKFQSVVNSLLVLAKQDRDFDIYSFLDDYQEHKAFTPKQLSLVMGRLDKHHVRHIKKYFKMKMRSNKEKDDFANLKDWQYKRIELCLSKHQIEYFKKRQGEF